MTALSLALGFWLGLALTGWCVWCVRVFLTRELPRQADWTTRLVYESGRAMLWIAALLVAGGLFGVAARAAWRAAEHGVV